MEYILLILLIIIATQVAYLTSRTPNSRVSGKGTPVFVDTSALMDGRIVTAASTGFISGRLVVLKSVLAELQMLADTGDSDKRAKARRGLDAVSELQAMLTTSVEIYDDRRATSEGVDARLIEYALKDHGHICTIDFNLNKVAKAENIFVLNINELAQSLRMAFLPGERITLELTQKGQDSHQAVGYLADGTMVVVEQAAKLIGQSVEIEFIRSLQTAAGRMMFAKLTKPAVSHTSADQRGRGTEPKASGKVRGRQPAESAGDTPRAKVPQRNSTATTNKSDSVRQPRNNRQKRTKEDSLIELVNKQ